MTASGLPAYGVAVNTSTTWYSSLGSGPVTGGDDTRLGNRDEAPDGGNLASMASGGTTRGFLAPLAGLTVLDPHAHQVGRGPGRVLGARRGAPPPPPLRPFL